MRKQDYLPVLIQSLSASEKRYFKVFCKSQTEGRKYLALFNILENKASYNAKEIARQLNITTAALANDKEYLQEVLFRNLRAFHENSSVENKLHFDYMNAVVLSKKNLTEYAESEARKVFEKSIKNELYTIAINTARLLSFIYKSLDNYEEIAVINRIEGELLEALTEYAAMIHLRDRLIEPVYTRKGFEGVKDIETHQLFTRHEKDIKSMRGRVCQKEIKIFFYRYVKPDKEKTLQYSLDMFKLFEKEPFLKTAIPSAYFNVLAKLCMHYYEAEQPKVSLNYVNTMLHITKTNELGIDDGVAKAYNSYACSIKMTLLTLTHNFSEAVAFGKEINSIKEHGTTDEKITFLFDYALALFHTANYDACLEQLDELINLKVKERTDTQLFGRLLFILVQLQFENYSLIGYQVKNLRAWIKRYKVTLPEVNELLGWLDKIGKAKTDYDQKEVFAAFKATLQSNNLQEMEKGFALKKWISDNEKKKRKRY